MTRMMIVANLALAVAVLGCGNTGGDTRSLDGGTDGGSDAGTDGGMDAGMEPMVLAESLAANEAWVDALCPCAVEIYGGDESPFNDLMCDLGMDLFLEVPPGSEFIFRALSVDQQACIDALVDDPAAAAAVECRTAAANDIATCFSEMAGCDVETDIAPCQMAFGLAHDACPEMPETWEDDFETCLHVTPSATVPLMASANQSACACAECPPEQEVTPEIVTCMIGVLDAALLDEETGEETQAALDCIYDIGFRANACFDDVTECGEDAETCTLLFFYGFVEYCEQTDEGAFISAFTECTSEES